MITNGKSAYQKGLKYFFYLFFEHREACLYGTKLLEKKNGNEFTNIQERRKDNCRWFLAIFHDGDFLVRTVAICNRCWSSYSMRYSIFLVTCNTTTLGICNGNSAEILSCRFRSTNTSSRSGRSARCDLDTSSSDFLIEN